MSRTGTLGTSWVQWRQFTPWSTLKYNPSSVPRNSKSEASVSWITQRAWAGTSSPYTRRFQDLPPSIVRYKYGCQSLRR